MKKFILSFVFVVAAFFAFAQDSPWSASVFYTPTLNAYNYNNSKVSFGNALGLGLGYKCNKFEIISGFNIQMPKEVDEGVHYSMYSSYLQGSIADVKYKSIYTRMYFSVPLSIKYTIIDRKFNLYALVGYSYNWLAYYKRYSDFEYYYEGTNDLITKNETSGDWTKYDDLFFKNNRFFLNIALGSNIDLTERIALFFEPRFAINFYQSRLESSAPNRYPHSFGLKTGVSWTF
jgi:hypothetical protein